MLDHFWTNLDQDNLAFSISYAYWAYHYASFLSVHVECTWYVALLHSLTLKARLFSVSFFFLLQSHCHQKRNAWQRKKMQLQFKLVVVFHCFKQMQKQVSKSVYLSKLSYWPDLPLQHCRSFFIHHKQGSELFMFWKRLLKLSSWTK